MVGQATQYVLNPTNLVLLRSRDFFALGQNLRQNLLISKMSQVLRSLDVRKQVMGVSPSLAMQRRTDLANLLVPRARINS